MIRAKDLTPDMVLAADLHTPQGRLLLTKGTRLTPDHLRVIKTWGVAEAAIEGLSEKAMENRLSAQCDPEILAMSQRLAERFFLEANQDHEAVKELMHLFVARSARQSPERLAKLLERVSPVTAMPLSQPFTPGKTLDLAGALAKGKIKFPSLPSIYAEITDAINNPRSSASYVAEIIGKDMSLAAKLLQMVNSAFFALPGRVDTLMRAVTIVGTNQLTTLALGISVVSLFDGIPSHLMDMRSFWRHSITCGTVARLVAGQVRNINEERYFVAGLLHDVGRLVMLMNYPDQALVAFQRAREMDCPLFEVEAEIWGMDHTEIASLLMQHWNFPGSLEKAVRFHHAPSQARSQVEPGIVHLADIIAHTLTSTPDGSVYVPALDPEAWKVLGLSKNILAVIATQVEHQLDELMQIFIG